MESVVCSLFFFRLADCKLCLFTAGCFVRVCSALQNDAVPEDLWRVAGTRLTVASSSWFDPVGIQSI